MQPTTSDRIISFLRSHPLISVRGGEELAISRGIGHRLIRLISKHMVEIVDENKILKLELTKRECQLLLDSLRYRELELIKIIDFSKQQGLDRLLEESEALLKSSNDFKWEFIRRANSANSSVNIID